MDRQSLKRDLEHLYACHDALEHALRDMMRMRVYELRAGANVMDQVWATHDQLERTIIEMQSWLQEGDLG